MKRTAALLIVALLSGCASSAHDRRMRDSGDDDSGTLRNIGIGLALVAVGAAAYYGAKRGGGGQANAVTDYDWDWDQFYHQGSLTWACRGVQTGQFAESSHCAYKPQNDLRWPGK